ncbi:MAG: FAD-dependent oxidoreductase, partial [Coriobacteriaceae bacterium]|nr:FAD-dependent oxidoreductase [Coriobacteriaceae bacterium]
MIEVANIRIPLARLGKTPESERAALVRELSRGLHADEHRLAEGLELRKRSIDARKRDRIALTYTVRASL